MLKDVIQIFEKEYLKGSTPENKDHFVIKDHIPVDGDYFVIRETEQGFEVADRVKIRYDKKTKNIEKTNKYFDFLQHADYMSRYLSSNKSIRNKNIYSNNYLTLFIKKETFFNGKITEEILADYYEVFKEPYKKKYKKPQLRKIYKLMEEKYGKADIDRINRIEAWVKEHLSHLDVENDKTHVKLFFLYDIKEYQAESEKYIQTNIYLKDKYNRLVNGKLFGVPNDNLALNDSKPYTEQKSRKNTSPILLSQEDVLLQKKFFDYLNNMATKGLVNLYFGEEGILALDNQEIPKGTFSGYFLRLQKGMEPEIHDFDVITSFSNEIRPVLIKNVLKIKQSNLAYRTVSTLTELEKVIDDIFFKKSLIFNYFREPQKITIYDEGVKKNLLLARTSLFNWFHKGMDDTVWDVLKTCSLDLIKGSIYRGEIWKGGGRACEQFNLYISLRNYFERRERMDNSILDVEKLREKINQKETGRIESDEEYYFAVGQLANYFLTLSRAKVRNHFLSKSILTAKTDEKIKNELKKLYHKYNYDIKFSRRFNNLYAMVCLYSNTKSQVNEDALLAGYLHSSLIYETKKDSNSDEIEMDLDKEKE
ncbi:type I-B CRISPR-associated protein Cas8b/Csh1 [Clostridium aminobutyricum]|uniref:Type I-B CRISPR-associated protein Cas8b/Csh1 n=1 Tax=Clostridium aminobutyricum TaxID=33953 RepID=A0A939D6S1_CLOAM|nr:type I-B CRISPR-associated protein Cas8b/Csh1 [Clostridium aminobutyricum]MBN7771878.1 type I-B CRISPR-associated protein Cas8b/Csh1 [Clostridium aminobutyricum]